MKERREEKRVKISSSLSIRQDKTRQGKRREKKISVENAHPQALMLFFYFQRDTYQLGCARLYQKKSNVIKINDSNLKPPVQLSPNQNFHQYLQENQFQFNDILLSGSNGMKTCQLLRVSDCRAYYQTAMGLVIVQRRHVTGR